MIVWIVELIAEDGERYIQSVFAKSAEAERYAAQFKDSDISPFIVYEDVASPSASE